MAAKLFQKQREKNVHVTCNLIFYIQNIGYLYA